ncbi:hypothetical protein CTAYLR_006585 [Chrysophaeum taylorii]|uniref:ABC transporter domain-containing protein n=1 Tax=Chrysophaeum taylorii TaxID=2483200 RepID=A0AAD7UMA2_9STRA|nr:hypothetical protein CTAYLR_006585 [Chrysophaeum taylorii]
MYDEDAEDQKEEDLELVWRDVRFEVPGKVILDNLWGSASAGRVTAIMGPSGCGKTTLLDFLAQRIDTKKRGRSVSGSITLVGAKARAAYVQQEDALVGVLTVAETLAVAAAFAGAPRSRADELVREFGLESAKDTMVGTIFQKGISGGQKRRLSIAVELVARPRLVLLDEPTSGLDSASALAVITQLSQIAGAIDQCKECKRVAVACTLHQPSNAVWALVDRVCFLAAGKLVYFGGTQAELLDFFNRCEHPVPQYANVADYVLSLINQDFPGHADVDEIVAAFAFDPPEVPPQLVVPDVTPPRAGGFSRFITLCGRGFKELSRDVGIIGVRLAMYTMLSALIALMFLDLGDKKGDTDVNARVSVLFYVAAFMVFMSVAVLPFYVIQRAVFVKERCNGAYDVPEYVAAKFVVALPGVFLIAIVSSVLIVFPAKLNGFPVYFLDLFVSLLVAESFMAFVAAIVPHFIVGIALAAGIFGFNMLVEGFFRVKHDIPVYLIWGYYYAFHTYTFRVFMHNEFNPISKFNGPQFRDGKQVLRFYDMGNVNVTHDFAVLIAWIVFFQICYTMVLYFYHTGRR